MFDLSLLDKPGSILIEHRDSSRSYLFANPERVIVASTPDEVQLALLDLDGCLMAGKYAAGYIGYESGLVLDKPLSSLHTVSVPLLWLAIYRDCKELDYEDVDLGKSGSPDDLNGFSLNIDEPEYRHAIARIKEYIAAGDVYQVNYTCKLLFENLGTARALFARLRNTHPVGYSAFVNMGSAQIISLSPELFLQREGSRVLLRPMKGTAKRGRWVEEDSKAASRLGSDAKNLAENVMIVDLMRNDIGKVCEMGGVSVPRLFHVEKYPTLFQMTSDVVGELRESVTTSELLTAVFPSGSITGAPKIRAMEIIEELEREARGVYCGAVGMFRPGGDCLLNVAIRTIVQTGSMCEMGVGSGIVADSDAGDEFKETLLKSAFVRSESREFRLLETLLYRISSPRPGTGRGAGGEGYLFLEEHLTRMSGSAEYFGWNIDKEKVRSILKQTASEIESKGCGNARVRLLVSRNGKADAEWSEIDPKDESQIKLLIVSRRTDPSDIFLYHKTTAREEYDKDFHEARAQGYFDALYINNRDEITECAITNIIIELDGKWYTPPLTCGLLPGIWRSQLLAEGEAEERVLTLDDLRSATRVKVGNSVRGDLDVCRIIIVDANRGSDETIFSVAIAESDI